MSNMMVTSTFEYILHNTCYDCTENALNYAHLMDFIADIKEHSLLRSFELHEIDALMCVSMRKRLNRCIACTMYVT